VPWEESGQTKEKRQNGERQSAVPAFAG